MDQKEIVQAVLIADNFNENFLPITNEISASLLPLVNTPLIDYALESLNRSGIEEVFVFCSEFVDQVKKHISDGIKQKCSWSYKMQVHVVGSEGCRCLGDALRDLYAKSLLRGHFILLGCDTITNANLGEILEQHKRKCNFDKGTAMTVVYKKISPGNRTGDEVVIALEKDSNRLLYHQRINSIQKERNFSFPLELFMIHSEVVLRHDFIDPQIAICSPSALPLFADNFDFEKRDDFIRGLLINEEILASTIYVHELPTEQYASKVSNWHTYQIISNDVINRWVYPLVPDMGICGLRQNYLILRNNVYRNKDVQLARGGILKEDVVIHEKSSILDGSVLCRSVVGKNCKIGKNCIFDHAYIFDNVTIMDNCVLRHCVVGRGAKICTGVTISDGAVIGDNVVIDGKSKISKHFIQSTLPEYNENSIKLGNQAYTIPDEVEEIGSDDEDFVPNAGLVRMAELECNYASSVYSSSSEEYESREPSPIPEDSNIFLSEVIDSLLRSYEEKSNPDFLILEINSSRYAYNMSLTEVNFFVVKAIFSLNPITEAGPNVMQAINLVLGHLGPVFKNYIRGDDAMQDCLKAIEESCNQDSNLLGKVGQIIHYLYDKELLTEDTILLWYHALDEDISGTIKNSLKKLVDWLEAASEEESSDEDD